MDKGKVTVTATPDGKARVEVSGVQGGGCLTVTKAIEKALGVVTEQTMKPEINSISSTTSAVVDQ